MAAYFPHVNLLLRSLRITRERLNSNSKIAIDTELLRALLQVVSKGLPFSGTFYAETYPDVAEGQSDGRIANLRQHMVEQGYFEGRIGAPPRVDEAFYLGLYPDVKSAIERGEVSSAAEHYIRSGAAEGRVPHPALQDEVNHWNWILSHGRGPAS